MAARRREKNWSDNLGMWLENIVPKLVGVCRFAYARKEQRAVVDAQLVVSGQLSMVGEQ